MCAATALAFPVPIVRRRARLLAGIVAIGCASFAVVAPASAQAPDKLAPPQNDDVAEREITPWTLRKFPPQPYMREVPWDMSPDTPAFFRDSLLQFVTRTYFLDRDNFNGTKSSAWALGGWVAFRSGLIGDVFGIQAAYYTSQKLYGPLDEDGTKLLAPGQNSLGMLGQLYGRAQFGDQEFRLGAQIVDTPLINAQDNRMVPNTFAGLTLVSLPDKERVYDYAVGYLLSVKQRDSNNFISMSDALASAAGNNGAPFAMLRLRPAPGLTATVMDYFVEDYVNSSFAQVEYTFQTPKDVPKWSLGANIMGQRSVGDDMLYGTPFSTYQASGKVQMQYAGFTLFAAGSITGEGQKITSPFGSKQNFTDMQQVSFDNAGENALGASAAYDFGALGLPGLSVGTWYTRGWGAIDPTTRAAIPDRREFDVWAQYRPAEGPLKGLRLRVAYGNVWQSGNVRDTQPEFRALLDYTVLFRPPTP